MTDSAKRPKRRFDQSLPIALLRAREASARLFKPHIDRYDLTMPQWRVIRALAEGGALDAKTVAECCVILPPSLTRIFRALTQRGLTRAVEAEDARRHMLELTEEGRAIFEAVVETSEVTYGELEAAFGAERMQTLLDLLNALRDTINDMPGQRRG
ncbi:MAG: homoprotocatechuate degradation operon regulator HpaR [Nocardiopsis sp. BM-2018]|nr:MAG: homoprotocatechuate degradation operon regulator HpaR [Nocardiopsis sp. BM-2018]